MEIREAFIIDGMADLEVANCISKCDSNLKYEVENRKVFHLASAAEKLTKAMLQVFP